MDSKQRYNELLKREKELHNFIDGDSPYNERIKKLPVWERTVAKLNDILISFPESSSKEVFNGFALPGNNPIETENKEKPKHFRAPWEPEPPKTVRYRI